MIMPWISALSRVKRIEFTVWRKKNYLQSKLALCTRSSSYRFKYDVVKPKPKPVMFMIIQLALALNFIVVMHFSLSPSLHPSVSLHINNTALACNPTATTPSLVASLSLSPFYHLFLWRLSFIHYANVCIVQSTHIFISCKGWKWCT